MSVQQRLAAFFSQLAESEHGQRRTHLEAWASFVATLRDEDPNVQALGRAQTRIGSPAEFTPTCDGGLHVRLLADSAPSEQLVEYLASLEGEPEPWAYGDWAQQGPAPERDGVPQWTVEVDILRSDDRWDWPPKPEHPDVEPVHQYGYGDVEEGRWHLSVTLYLYAPGEAEALALTRELLAGELTGSAIVAHRFDAQRTPGELEDKPRGPEDLRDSFGPVRWQRGDVDGSTVTIVWDSVGEGFERVEVDEHSDEVVVTVFERFGPLFDEDGTPTAIAAMYVFRPRCVCVELDAPLGTRRLIDGATGRAPGDLTVWEWRERELRENVLAVSTSKIKCEPGPPARS